MVNKRVDIKALLADPIRRMQLCVASIIATQALEGIVTTREQAEAAYYKALSSRQRVLLFNARAKQLLPDSFKPR
jgi:hypothetical protein